MVSFKNKIRRYLWHILGFTYPHVQRINDHVFLKEDRYTSVGEGTYDNHAIVYRWSDAKLIIGKYCSISYGVKFIMDDGGHKTNRVTSYPFKGNPIGAKRGIIIGNDVWIGMDSIILYGVKVGNGVTIAAGSVVTKDVPDYCVVAGVPARVIRRKCSQEDANRMNEIAWWNWDEEEIKNRVGDFKLSFYDFIQKYK